MTSDATRERFLPDLLCLASDKVRLEFERVCKDRHGMLPTEWGVMFHLAQDRGLTARDICARANLNKTKVSRAVAALEAKRFLARTIDPRDARRERLDLTATGRAVHDELNRHATRFEAELTADLSRDEVTLLRAALSKLAKLAAPNA